MSTELKKTGAAIKREVFNRNTKYNNKEKVKGGLAHYGIYNDLPDKLLKLRDDSIWHDIALRGKIKYFQGDGLAYENQMDLPDKINDRGHTPNDLLEQSCTNWALYQGFAAIVIWDTGSVAGTNDPRIAEIIPVGFDKLRAEESDSTGLIQHWYLAKKWDKKTTRDYETEAEKIPAFNPNKVAKTVDTDGQPKQILVVKEYNPASDYYPEPSYKGALNAILTHSVVQKFKLAHLNNAIAAALHIKLIGDFSDEQMEELVADIDSQMAGALNAGNYMLTHAVEAGQGVTFETLPAGGAANIYDSYSEMAQQEILSGHGIIFKEAVGLEEESKGLSAEQIQEKFTVFFNTTIRKAQQKILSGLNKLSPYFDSGQKWEINKIDILEGLEVGEDENITDEEEDTTLSTLQ